MTDAPPFDPPYFSVERTAQGVRVMETRADGSRQERTVPIEEAAGLLIEASNSAPAASLTTRNVPKKSAQKSARSPSGMPPGSTLISVPFAEKDGAKKLGARWNAERRSWYVPPGIELSLFSRWRIEETDL